MRKQDLPDRHHPHRLTPEQYGEAGRPCLVTCRALSAALLTKPEVAETLRATLGRIGARRKVRVHAYWIMPEHMHVVCSLGEPTGDLEKWIRYVKREVATALHRPGMWQRSFWDRTVWDGDGLTFAVEYVLDNPVRRGLARTWQEWPYSWSRWHPESRGADPNIYAERAG
jgi:REP element-mobilizing transposase RayT